MGRSAALGSLALPSALLALALVASAGARAQEREGPAHAHEPREAEAQALFRQGLTYREAERWGEALEYFRRSWELARRPSTAFNVAVVLLRLARPTEALGWLDDFLRLADPVTDAERRAEARRLLELALASIARLTLTVDPTSALVRVDGRNVGGEGAVREIRLDPGSHAVRVEAEGHQAESFDLALLDGESIRRSVTLRRLPELAGPPVLRVTSSVATAAISIDGEEVGQGTWVGEVSAGAHRVEIRADGWVTFRRTVEVAAGERADVQASLSRPERGLLAEPLFWIVTGAVVLAGVGVGIALSQTVDDPYAGTTGVVLQGLRWP